VQENSWARFPLDTLNPAACDQIMALWAVIFIYMGRSEVTGVTLSFHVARDRV